MGNNVENEIIKGAMSMVGTLAGVLIGGILTLRTYRSNQLWETKKRLYDEVIKLLERNMLIVHALMELEESFRFCDLIVIHHNRIPPELVPPDVIESAGKLTKQLLAFQNEVVSRHKTSNYLLSDGSIRILDELQKVLEDHKDTQASEALYAAYHLAFQRALFNFIDSARIDLGVMSFRARVRRRARLINGWSGWATAWETFIYSSDFLWVGHAKAEKRRYFRNVARMALRN